MKTSKLFITSLLAAATMSVPAFAWTTGADGLPVITDFSETASQSDALTISENTVYKPGSGSTTTFTIGDKDLVLDSLSNEGGNGKTGEFVLTSISGGTGGVWFKSGSWKLASATISTTGDLYLQGGQFWVSAEKTIANNVFLGTSSFIAPEGDLARSALRIGATANLTGTTTILSEGTNIAFQGGALNITKLSGSGNITTSQWTGDTGTRVITVANAEDFTGTISLANRIQLNWSSSTATFGGLSGTGTVAGDSNLNIKDAQNTTFSGTVGSSTNGVALALSGSGTQAFTGTNYFSTVSVSDTAKLDLSASTNSVSGDITLSGGTLALGSVANLSSDTALLSTSGGSVTISGSVAIELSGVIKNGTYLLLSGTEVTLNEGYALSLSGLTNSGWSSAFSVVNNALQVVITGAARDLVWAGSSGATWNTSATNWNESGFSTATDFANGDSVEFTSDAEGTVSVGEAVSVNDLKISSGAHIFTVANGGSVTITGTATIESGATLDLGTATGGTGLLRGAITVKDGGTLRFSAKDVTGYDGGGNSLSTITVNSGGVLELAHSENETFAGTLNLNGTLKAAESLSGTPRFDFFGNATLNVGEGTTAKITGVNIGLRRNDVIFTVGNNSTLTIDGVISNSWSNASSGNGTLTKAGNGKLVMTKAEGAATAPVSTITRFVNNGTTRVEGGATLNITGTGTNDNGSLNWGTFEIGAGSSVNVTADFKASAWSGSNWGVKALNVEEGATLSVGGSMRNAAGLTLKNGGLITAGTIDYSSAGGWSTNTFSGNGYIVADTFNVGNTTQVVFENQTFVVGGFSWSWYNNEPREIRLGNATFGAKQDWSTDSAFTLTGSKDNTVSADDVATTTVFNTGAFDAGRKTFSETTGHTITLGGVLSGKGGLKKTGAGTLKLSGNNTFEGGVTLSAGTLELGHNNALGSAALMILGTGEQSPELKLGADASGNALTVSNDFSVVGSVTISSTNDANVLAGTISAYAAAIQKVGSGTLTLSGTNTEESIFTVDIAEGKLIAGTATALGVAATAETAPVHKVRLSGGQLEVGSGVTLAQTNIEIALSSAYATTAAITGAADSALAADTVVTISSIDTADLAGVSLLTESAITRYEFKIAYTLTDGLTEADFSLAQGLLDSGWDIAGYENGTLSLTLTVPEPSAFGLLAGAGALALVAARRRRTKRA